MRWLELGGADIDILYLGDGRCYLFQEIGAGMEEHSGCRLLKTALNSNLDAT